MARKKHDQDAAADFFGDGDVDWMSDEEEAANGVASSPPSVPPVPASRAPDSERLPVAPPPPPSVRTATPLDGNIDPNWADKVTDAPADGGLAGAPTLVFSSVPTLPPQPTPHLSRGEADPDDLATMPMSAVTPGPGGISVPLDEPARAQSEVQMSATPEPPPGRPAEPEPDAKGKAAKRGKATTMVMAAIPASVQASTPTAPAERVDRPRPAPVAKVEPAEPAKPEPPRPEPPKPEPAKPEPKPEPAKPVAKVDPGPGRPVARVEPPKAQAPRSEPPKPEAPRPTPVASASAVPPLSANPPVPAADPDDASTENMATAAVVVEDTREEPRPASRAPASRPTPVQPPVQARKVAPPPPESLPPHDYALAQGADAWRDGVSILRAEAEGATGLGKAVLLSTAARIGARRLGELDEAAECLDAAVAAGDTSPTTLRMLAELRGSLDQPAEQEHALLQLARASTSVDRAEAYLEAALVAWRRLDRPEQAAAHLREAAKAHPADYTSRALLRALLPAIGGSTTNERIDLLDQLSDLSEGGIAADARVEQAGLAEEVSRADVLRTALEKALEAEPGHTFAFQQLERVLASAPADLAALYEREAARAGQPDPGWWKLAAGRAHLAAGASDRAFACLSDAVRADYTFALRELAGDHLRAERYRELEGVLAQEAEMLSPAEGQAHVLFRLGWLREIHLTDIEGALAAYRQAVEVDPTASPAAHAVARLVGDDERAKFLTACAKATPDPEERRALKLWLAENAEASGDNAGARVLYQDLFTSEQGVEVEIARDGLDRVLQRLADVSALSELRRERAESTTDMNDRVAWLLLAGSIPADRGVALPMWSSALDARPDHPVALAAVSVALEFDGRWDELARRMRAAGESATDPQRRAAYLYRAGRVMADRGGDPGVALACVTQALTAEPRLRSARWLARSLYAVRVPAVEAALYREQSTFATDPVGRAWAAFASAVMCGSGDEARADLDAVLSEEPSHPGALAALEVQLVAERERAGLVALYRRAIGAAGEPATDRRQALIAARAAELLIEIDRVDDAVVALRKLRGVDGAPIRAGARLALKVGEVDRAIELLGASELEEDRVERARLLMATGRNAEALPLLLDLVGGSYGVGAAARAATVAQQLGDTVAMIRAYAAIAQAAHSDALRAAYASWTAMQLQAIGRDAEALEHWLVARRLRPNSTLALYGAMRGHIQRREPTRITALFGEARGDATGVLADALVDAGDLESAASVLSAHVTALERAPTPPEPKLAAYVVLERLRTELDDWPGTYEALVHRRELCRDAIVRAQADAARRWLLAEKLANTDAAWDMYRQLHEDAPYDRQVTDALARIAAARGEVTVAIGYLDELAESAGDKLEAARYRRRIGEVHEKAGDPDSARQAYLDALDHVQDDREALEGLRRLAEQAKDWTGLVAVLQREAGSADPKRQLELRRQIAVVTEDRIGDRKVAMDAWRSLLELDPNDREGLQRLLALAEGLGEWAMFVETGEVLAQQLPSRDRATLLRKMGIVCQDRLGRNDAVRYYEQAVAIQPPDHEAAVRLEGLARGRADWPAVVRALRLQAAADVEADRRVDALLKAARIEVEALHDKDAGANCYRQVLELRPDHEAALRYMSTYLFDARRFDEALPVCERLEPLLEHIDDLDDFDTQMELSSFYFYFAEILRAKSDNARALARYEKALTFNGFHLPSLEAVAPLYVDADQWSNAERVYRQLLQLSGGQGDRQRVASTYTSLGLVERKLGNADRAYKRFTKALELHPNHVGALKGVALILEDRQDWSNLLNVYNNVIYHATVPEDVVDAYMTKGRILDDQMQRQDKAAQHYQRTLDLDPNQPAAYLRLAELAMRRDAYAEAGDLSERGLQLDADVVHPMRALLLVVRGAAWQDAGRTSEAERCLREARMLDPQLVSAIGDVPLQDLERLRRVIKDRLPK